MCSPLFTPQLSSQLSSMSCVSNILDPEPPTLHRLLECRTYFLLLRTLKKPLTFNYPGGPAAMTEHLQHTSQSFYMRVSLPLKTWLSAAKSYLVCWVEMPSRIYYTLVGYRIQDTADVQQRPILPQHTSHRKSSTHGTNIQDTAQRSLTSHSEGVRGSLAFRKPLSPA